MESESEIENKKDMKRLFSIEVQETVRDILLTWSILGGRNSGDSYSVATS